MAGTFTLTATLEDHGGVPYAETPITIYAGPTPDTTNNVVYSGGLSGDAVTDVNGQMSIELACAPLAVDLYYRVTSEAQLFAPIVVPAQAEGASTDISSWTSYEAGSVDPSVLTQAIAARDEAVAAAANVTTELPALLAADPTPANAAAAAVSTALNSAGVMHDAYPVNSSNSGYLFVIADGADNILFGIKPDGTVEAQIADTAAVPFFTALTGNPFSKNVAQATGYLYAITDSADNLLMGVRTDGSVEFGAAIAVPSGSITAAMLASDASTRLPALATDYDKAGIGRNLWITTPTGPKQLTATPDIACWGDSMTDGYPTTDFTDRTTMPFPAVLDSLLSGATVYNGGSTGQSADEVAIRQGGLSLQVTVSGGSIPASGGVTVAETSTIAWRLDRGFDENVSTSGVLCTIAGVPGKMTRSGSVLTFTRTTSGSAVPVTGAQTVTFTPASTYAGRVNILFAGRNDIGYTTTPALDSHDRVVNAHVAMVEKVKADTVRPRVLILGCLTATTELSGSTNYTLVTRINSTLKALYPSYFATDPATGYSLKDYLVKQVIYDLGITPTSGDLTNMAGDTLPPSIMASSGTDAVHYSVATAAKVAAWIKNRLVEKGWAA